MLFFLQSRLSPIYRGPVVALALMLLAGCASEPMAPPRPVHPPINMAIVRDALSMKGIPYRWGEETPHRGFDCSGLVQYVYGRHGVSLPRTAYQMAMALPELEEEQRRPGDLLFFNTTGKPYSHVGIYIGHDQMVHASSAKGKVVVGSLNTPYWSQHYLGMRRPMDLESPEPSEPALQMGHWVP
jgi:hypothetical protein